MIEDLKSLEFQVSEVIKYTQGFTPNVKELIAQWYKAKKDFINLFGDNLYIRSPEKVHIDLSEEDITYKVKDFCKMLKETFPQYEDLIYFIKENKKDIFQNILSKNFNFKNYNIKSGIKISKALKEFVDNEVDLYFIQTAFSRIIQESKLSGYLYLSVHPLDYLSSSENNSKWRSCHALDGGYRAGNLSYMLDSSTIVCYIADEEKEQLHSFPSTVIWNNKKWRMLLFVSENKNALFAGRHYPFFSEILMDKVKDMFVESLGSCYLEWSGWHNDRYDHVKYIKNSRDDKFLAHVYIPIREHIVSLNQIIKDKSQLHFNDLLNSSCYQPYYCWDVYNMHPIAFNIGNKVKCLKCNSAFIEDPNIMMCPTCEYDANDYINCYCCGTAIEREDSIYIDTEGVNVCPDCFEEYYGICHNCGDIYKIEKLWYNDNDGCFYCKYCKGEN